MLSLRNKIRNLIKDTLATQIDTFTYTSSKIFILTEVGVTISSITVNGVANTAYTFSTVTNAVTMTGTLVSGDVLIITYTYYNYTDTELNAYIAAALDFIATYGYQYFEVSGTTVIPTPTLAEKSLIATSVYMLIEPEYSEYRLPNVVIRYPRKASKEEKIEQLVHRFKFNSAVIGVLTQTEE